MTGPYWTSDEDSDEEESLNEADLGNIEDDAIQKAIQASLQSFQQESDPISEMDKPTDLPRRYFTTEEIEQDELRRERELFGSPTPPLQSRKVTTMNSSEESSTPSDAMVGTSGETRFSIAGFGGTAATSCVQDAVSSAQTNHEQVFPDALIAGVKSADFGQTSLNKSADTMVSEIVNAMMEYNKAGNTACPEDLFSPVYDGGASGAAHGTNESDYFAQHFDDMDARRHADRVAIMEAALNDPSADLGAVMRALHPRHITAGAPARPAAWTAGDQATPAGRSSRAASQPARDEELEWFQGESSASLQPASKPAKPRGQRTRPH